MLKSLINILFFILVNVRNWLYDSGFLNIYKSQLPVISIGNITAGGTGKTPFVLYTRFCLPSLDFQELQLFFREHRDRHMDFLKTLFFLYKLS